MCNGCSNCEKVCPVRRDYLCRQGIPRTEPDNADPARGAGQSGGLPGLRRVYGRVHVRRDGPQGLYPTNRLSRRWTQYAGKDWKPTIVAFCCNWCSYAGADLAGTNRLQYPANVKIIRVPCSCRRQSHVHPPRVSAGRGRRDSLRLPPRRLPLHDWQLLRPAAHDAAVFHAGLISAWKKSARAWSGFPPPRARSLPRR